jgi:hypothetical protein
MLAIVASGFFVAAFVREPLYAHLYRPWTRVAVYCAFAAALVDVVNVVISCKATGAS